MTSPASIDGAGANADFARKALAAMVRDDPRGPLRATFEDLNSEGAEFLPTNRNDDVIAINIIVRHLPDKRNTQSVHTLSPRSYAERVEIGQGFLNESNIAEYVNLALAVPFLPTAPMVRRMAVAP